MPGIDGRFMHPGTYANRSNEYKPTSHAYQISKSRKVIIDTELTESLNHSDKYTTLLAAQQELKNLDGILSDSVFLEKFEKFIESNDTIRSISEPRSRVGYWFKTPEQRAERYRAIVKYIVEKFGDSIKNNGDTNVKIRDFFTLACLSSETESGNSADTLSTSSSRSDTIDNTPYTDYTVALQDAVKLHEIGELADNTKTAIFNYLLSTVDTTIDEFFNDKVTTYQVQTLIDQLVQNLHLLDNTQQVTIRNKLLEKLQTKINSLIQPPNHDENVWNKLAELVKKIVPYDIISTGILPQIEKLLASTIKDQLQQLINNVQNVDNNRELIDNILLNMSSLLSLVGEHQEFSSVKQPLVDQLIYKVNTLQQTTVFDKSTVDKFKTILSLASAPNVSKLLSPEDKLQIESCLNTILSKLRQNNNLTSKEYVSGLECVLELMYCLQAIGVKLPKVNQDVNTILNFLLQKLGYSAATTNDYAEIIPAVLKIIAALQQIEVKPSEAILQSLEKILPSLLEMFDSQGLEKEDYDKLLPAAMQLVSFAQQNTQIDLLSDNLCPKLNRIVSRAFSGASDSEIKVDKLVLQIAYHLQKNNKLDSDNITLLNKYHEKIDKIATQQINQLKDKLTPEAQDIFAEFITPLDKNKITVEGDSDGSVSRNLLALIATRHIVLESDDLLDKLATCLNDEAELIESKNRGGSKKKYRIDLSKYQDQCNRLLPDIMAGVHITGVRLYRLVIAGDFEFDRFTVHPKWMINLVNDLCSNIRNDNDPYLVVLEGNHDNLLHVEHDLGGDTDTESVGGKATKTVFDRASLTAQETLRSARHLESNILKRAHSINNTLFSHHGVYFIGENNDIAITAYGVFVVTSLDDLVTKMNNSKQVQQNDLPQSVSEKLAVTLYTTHDNFEECVLECVDEKLWKAISQSSGFIELTGAWNAQLFLNHSTQKGFIKFNTESKCLLWYFDVDKGILIPIDLTNFRLGEHDANNPEWLGHQVNGHDGNSTTVSNRTIVNSQKLNDQNNNSRKEKKCAALTQINMA